MSAREEFNSGGIVGPPLPVLLGEDTCDWIVPAAWVKKGKFKPPWWWRIPLPRIQPPDEERE